MNNFKKFLEKLSSRPKIGALQITDSQLQYAIMEDGRVANFSLRLTPGVIREGKVENRDMFITALAALRKMIPDARPGGRIKVVASLPPSLIYTQSFSVPKIDEEKLDEAARLNLQIISPIDASKSVMSYEIVGETEDRYDLLGSFAMRSDALIYRELLSAAGFDGFIFEFPALALARLVKATLSLPAAPFLMLQISSDGIELSILRGGSLYFEYFRSWRSIQGEAREITRAAFEKAITEEVRRVVDFSLSRFKENPAQAFLVAPGFENQVSELIQAAFGIKVYPLAIKNYTLSPSWYATLGSALRGRDWTNEDRSINLSGENLAEELHKEQLLNFVLLWRNIMIGVAAVMLVVFMGAAAFLTRQANTLSSRLTSFRANVSQQELTALTASVEEFNYLVQGVAKAKGATRDWYVLLSGIKKLADGVSVSIDGLSVGVGKNVTLSGRAPSTSAVIKFKNILTEEEGFSDVNLPLAAISTLTDNTVSFNVSFQVQQ
ncbi:MAG TPA: hypothetical protein VNK70_03255 [Candidatus Paceibacterota bacterium]|nr:hypothetical protein [Candidatus Paceibacterota bacterium]